MYQVVIVGCNTFIVSEKPCVIRKPKNSIISLFNIYAYTFLYFDSYIWTKNSVLSKKLWHNNIFIRTMFAWTMRFSNIVLKFVHRHILLNSFRKIYLSPSKYSYRQAEDVITTTLLQPHQTSSIALKIQQVFSTISLLQ